MTFEIFLCFVPQHNLSSSQVENIPNDEALPYTQPVLKELQITIKQYLSNYKWGHESKNLTSITYTLYFINLF